MNKLTSWKQTTPYSCAASCIQVFDREYFDKPMSKEKEHYIHKQIFTKGIGNLPGNIYKYLTSDYQVFTKLLINRKNQLIKLKPIWRLLSNLVFNVHKKNIQKQLKKYCDDSDQRIELNTSYTLEDIIDIELENDQKWVMAMITVGDNLLHYVLLRHRSRKIVVMDPLRNDDENNIEYTRHEFLDFYKHRAVGIYFVI